MIINKLKPEPVHGKVSYRTFNVADLKVYPGGDWAVRNKRYFALLQDRVRFDKDEIDPVLVYPGPFGPEVFRNAGELLALKSVKETAAVRCHCVEADPASIALSLVREFAASPIFNRIDLAGIFRDLLSANQWRHHELGEALGLSGHSITNTLRLEKLDPRVKVYIRVGKLDVAKAKHLISLEPSRQVTLAHNAVVKGWTLKRLIKEIQGDFEKLPTFSGREAQETESPYIAAANKAIDETVPYPARVSENASGGLFFDIKVHSFEELSGIAELLESKIGGAPGFSGSISIGPMPRDKFDELFGKLVDDF